MVFVFVLVEARVVLVGVGAAVLMSADLRACNVPRSCNTTLWDDLVRCAARCENKNMTACMHALDATWLTRVSMMRA